MVKVQEFLVVFDNPSAVYRPGEVVSGRVFVRLQQPVKMTGIRFELLGAADVYWSESSTDSDGNTTSTSYSAKEVYIDAKMLLFGPVEHGSTATLEAGTHNFPFIVQLPYNIPSSFQGSCGKVTYTVTAYIDRPWKFSRSVRAPIVVVVITDLNTSPLEYQQPWVENKELPVGCCGGCCCCWGDETVSATIRLNRRCFVPGETIFIDAEIVNHSQSEIAEIRAELIEDAVFRADGGSTRNGSTVKAVATKNEVVKPNETAVWNNVPITVPDIVPVNLDTCRIIDLDYKLRLTIDAWCTLATMTIKVIIGNVPLRQDLFPFQQQALTSQPFPRPLEINCQLAYPAPGYDNAVMAMEAGAHQAAARPYPAYVNDGLCLQGEKPEIVAGECLTPPPSYEMITQATVHQPIVDHAI